MILIIDIIIIIDNYHNNNNISRCPDTSILSPFSYDRLTGTAEAQLFSMFKFPESNRVHFQCDILICQVLLL